MPFGFTRSILGTPLPVAASAVSLGLSPVLDTRSGQYSTSAYEQVNLSSAFAPYVGSTGRLVFQYTSGSSFTGDIQVDDINIGSSNNYSFEATGQGFETTTNGSTDATYTDTFYQALSFTSVLTSGIASGRWNRDLGGTSSGSTGLAFADAGSYYLYVEVTGSTLGFPNKVTWLKSPEVTLDTATLNFALGRYGATIGTLRVFWEVTSLPPLYSFSSFTFTDGGQTGYTGPSLSTLLASSDYDTGTYTWLSNTDYFDVDSTVQGMQLWTVPETGSYRITAKGAPGGSVGTTAFTGGIGAEISGEFTLTKGDILEIVVGQAGSDRNSGTNAYGGACGGGGSFVVARNGSTSSDIYVIAGGGGGAEADNRFSRGTSTHGGSGRSTVTGGNSSNSGGTYGQPAPNYTAGSFGDRTKGGGSGYGGGGGVGGGGGGFFDRGGTGNNGTTTNPPGTSTQCGYGYLTGTGYVAANRARGGRSNTSLESGGFGGGAGSAIATGYGGGGGGYSGGGAGTFVSSTQGNGGGGGSYNSGTNQTSTTYTEATHPGSLSGHDAFVTIEAI